MNDTTRLIDLSHPIHSGMEAYPGLPSPRVEPLISHAASRATYAGRAEFTITRISMVGNTGTYLDAPWHRHAAARDVAELPLEILAAVDGICLDGYVDEREVRIATRFNAATDPGVVIPDWTPTPLAAAVLLFLVAGGLVAVDLSTRSRSG